MLIGRLHPLLLLSPGCLRVYASTPLSSSPFGVYTSTRLHVYARLRLAAARPEAVAAFFTTKKNLLAFRPPLQFPKTLRSYFGQLRLEFPCLARQFCLGVVLAPERSRGEPTTPLSRTLPADAAITSVAGRRF